MRDHTVQGDRAAREVFTEEEQRALAPYFTNLASPIFALINLPETVKGALFARYSRSAKSLRRLFLDQFPDRVRAPARPDPAAAAAPPGHRPGAVLQFHGDRQSLAQLGGAH